MSVPGGSGSQISRQSVQKNLLYDAVTFAVTQDKEIHRRYSAWHLTRGVWYHGNCFSEVTFTEPLSFATFFSQYIDLPFPLSTLRIHKYVLLASWCNERSVRTTDQWRAGLNSGVQFSNKVSLFSDGFFLSIVTTDDKNGV
jgi:hypothetical protein